MTTTKTSKFGNKFTTYIAANPYKVVNGVSLYKTLVVFHSRVGRVVYDRYVTFIHPVL